MLLVLKLYLKLKFSDSTDKFLEADELEKGNIDVLHWLALSYLQSQKTSFADSVIKRGLQINPADLELQRDELTEERVIHSSFAGAR